MKKVLLLIFTLFFFISPIQAQILTGEVNFNEENYISEVKTDFIKNYYFDKNNKENANTLKAGIKEFKDRKVFNFSDGSYGIKYYDDPLYSWYYSEDGKLINFTKRESEKYPCKTVKYKPNGSIANIGYLVSQKESYIYSPNGKLIAHWLNQFCYDKYGNIIMTRSEVPD